MNVTLATNSASAFTCQWNPSFLQTAGTLNERGVTYIGNASRLIRDSNGLICLIEKTPAEVVGEQILQPLLDKVSIFTSYLSSFMQYLPSLLSLPGVDAAEVRLKKDACSMNYCPVLFPSEAAIASCLERHPLLGKQMAHMFIAAEISIPVAAEFFAYRLTTRLGVHLEAARIVNHLQGDLYGPAYLPFADGEPLAYALEACTEVGGIAYIAP